VDVSYQPDSGWGRGVADDCSHGLAEGVDVPVISVRALAGDGALGGLGGGSGLFEVSKDDDVFVVEGGGGGGEVVGIWGGIAILALAQLPLLVSNPHPRLRLGRRLRGGPSWLLRTESSWRTIDPK